MNIRAFNIGLALGWLMAVVGSMLISVPAGLVGGGLLLLVLVFLSVRMAGGLYVPAREGEGT